MISLSVNFTLVQHKTWHSGVDVRNLLVTLYERLILKCGYSVHWKSDKTIASVLCGLFLVLTRNNGTTKQQGGEKSKPVGIRSRCDALSISVPGVNIKK